MLQHDHRVARYILVGGQVIKYRKSSRIEMWSLENVGVEGLRRRENRVERT